MSKPTNDDIQQLFRYVQNEMAYWEDTIEKYPNYYVKNNTKKIKHLINTFLYTNNRIKIISFDDVDDVDDVEYCTNRCGGLKFNCIFKYEYNENHHRLVVDYDARLFSNLTPPVISCMEYDI